MKRFFEGLGLGFLTLVLLCAGASLGLELSGTPLKEAQVSEWQAKLFFATPLTVAIYHWIKRD